MNERQKEYFRRKLIGWREVDSRRKQGNPRRAAERKREPSRFRRPRLFGNRSRDRAARARPAAQADRQDRGRARANRRRNLRLLHRNGRSDLAAPARRAADRDAVGRGARAPRAPREDLSRRIAARRTGEAAHARLGSARLNRRARAGAPFPLPAIRDRRTARRPPVWPALPARRAPVGAPAARRRGAGLAARRDRRRRPLDRRGRGDGPRRRATGLRAGAGWAGSRRRARPGRRRRRRSAAAAAVGFGRRRAGAVTTGLAGGASGAGATGLAWRRDRRACGLRRARAWPAAGSGLAGAATGRERVRGRADPDRRARGRDRLGGLDGAASMRGGGGAASAGAGGASTATAGAAAIARPAAP